MKTRKVAGLEIKPIIFGGNVFGWTVDEKQSFLLLDAFLDHGFSMIDTADMYSNWIPGNVGGESETIIGKWMKERNNREKVIIATKSGLPMSYGQGLSKKYIKEAIEKSLKRLDTDYIDLYQAHTDDPEVNQLESIEAFNELIQEGKVRFIGASNFSSDRLASAVRVAKENKLTPYQTYQPCYNLYDREFEEHHRDVCIENNLSVISYFSLASGFLSGKYKSMDDLSNVPRGGSVSKYMNPRGERILQALDKISRETGFSFTQISLSWLLSQKGLTAPIVSATKLSQLEEILSASDQLLSSDHLELLNHIV